MTFRPTEQDPRCPVCDELAARYQSSDGEERELSTGSGFASDPMGARPRAERATREPGKHLADVLTGEPLGVLAAVQVVETLARALDQAHQRGLVHGNLDPAKIPLVVASPPSFANHALEQLVDENGRVLIPRLTDSGFLGDWERSDDGRGVGPRCYLAPEQARGWDPTPATDVYALGAILYRLLTGRPPFEGGTAEEVRRLIIERLPIPPSGLNPKVHGDLEAICMNCLEKDPTRRLSDAAELADALRQFLDSFTTQFQCSRCHRPLKSSRPLRIGAALVRCPRCGEASQVQALGGPRSSAHTPASMPSRTPPPVDSKVPTLRSTPSRNSNPGPHAPQTSPSTPPATAQAPGMPEVSGYTILGELGRGGMGVVYKAREEKLKRVVALKMILIDPKTKPQYLTRFQAEAVAVARLHHPNIVQIFEVGEQDGWPYLALECVTGGTLKKRLDGQPQPVRAAVQFVRLLARAVHAAHQRGIVHLDLKPANILLEPASLDDAREGLLDDAHEAAQLYGIPKVSDFGLARRLDDDLELVRNGEVLGTPLYMAPEQAKGQSTDVGPAADVYSLGVILYEMLTGQTPFQAGSVFEVLRRVTTTPAKPPRQLRKHLSRDLDAICRRCLEKDPRQRYRTALSLAEDLERFLNGEPVRARPPSAPERWWNWSLRNPVPSVLLLTVSSVLLFGQWRLRSLANEMVISTAKESAAQQTALLKTMNSLYTEVASRAKAAGIQVTHKYPDVEDSIPIPAKFTIELGQRMQSLAESSDQTQGLDQSFVQLKLYSSHPFRNRIDSPPRHQFGKEALDFFQSEMNKNQPFQRIEKTRAGARVLRYATPLILEDRCLKCHNDSKLYEVDKYRKTDWKAGEVRGVLEIVCPLEDNTEHTQDSLFTTYMQVGGTAAAVLGFSWCVLAIGRRRRR
jgi:serine/threonine protein kinase